MAEEKVKVDIGRGSGGGSSGGGSSAGGSYSKSSSSGNSNAGKASTSSKSSSKASTGNSSSRYSGTANYSKAASNARTAVNNAKTRPRAGTSYVVNRESAKTASRQGGTYRGAINSPSAGKQGFGASGSMQGLQEGRESGRTPVEREQSVEDSYLQASILELARGAKGEAIKGDGTAYDYANQLIKLWNSGKDVVPVVKDGVVKWERGADRTGTRIFYDFDAKGNRIKTADKKLQDANNTAMWTDIDAWLNYANSGNLTKADNIKQSGRIAEYMRAIENGLMDNYDVEKQNGEKLSLYDYLGELFDLRDQLDVQARKQEGATALRYFAQQIDDVRTRMANGSDYDVSKLGADYDSLLKYTSQYSGDEDFAELFTALSNDYYKVYRNGLQTQVGDLDAQLKAAQNAGLVAEQSVNSMNFNDVIVSDEDRQKIEANAEAARANTQSIFDQKTAAEDQLAWLDNEYRERNMTPEVAAAMERLSIAQLGKAYPDAHGKADAERMRQEDQALADEWNRSLELNPQYYNWQDRIAGVSKSFAARTAGSAVNLAAWAANATTYENDEIREATQARDMAARAYLADATPENKAALDAAEASLKQAQWNLATWQTERTGVAPKLESVANSLDARTQEEIAKAKEGASQLGQFGLDFLSTTMDMGFDALTGGGLKTMFARVAGSGIGEARRAGASSGEQLAYGLAQGAVEVFTEKLTDGLGAVYGKGISTDVVEKAISRLSSSDAGANFLRVLSGAIGEGGEEVVSDLLNPFTQWIIDEGARDNRVYDVDLSEALYDFLLGGAVGLVGQGGEVARGEYAAKNADIRQGDAEILEKAANAKATGQQLNSRDLSDLRAAQAREERQGVKGGLIIGPNGGLVAAPGVSGARSVTSGKNRYDTATNVIAPGFEEKGYVNPANPDEAYAAATTGAQGPRTDTEANQQSYAQEIEAEAERQAEAEEARKAEEAREANRKENTELEEQARIREQEAEGAKRAAQAFQDEQNAQLKAAQEAEKYAQLAHNAREFQAEQDFLRQAQQARQAAEEAGRKAEEQMAMAESQGQAIEAQGKNPTPAPENQEEANQEIAGSQSAALAGQDTSPVEAPQNADLATVPETAPGAQVTSTQANTQAKGIEAVKPTANEQGVVSAAIATAEEGRAAIESGETNNKTVAEVIPMVDKHVSESEPISTVAQNVFESRGSGKTPLSDRVANWIKSRFPTGVHSKAINGNVIVDKRGIKNDIAHGVGEAKAATFAAVPDVLDKGTIVSRSDGSVKGRSVTIAGKVMLNGSPVNVYCVVKQNSGDNRFYLHEVSDGNGTVFYKLGQNNNATPALLDSTGTNPASADVTSTVSIAQNPQAGNITNSSTNVQADGTIETKGVTANDSQADTRIATRDRERSKSGSDSGIQEKGSGVRKTRASQVSGEARTRLDAELSQFNARGRETVSDSEYTDSMRELEDLGDCAVSFAVGGDEDYGYDGFTDSSEDSFGVVVTQAEDSNVEAGETAVHEITHFRLHAFTPKVPNYVSVPSRLKYIVKNVMPSSYYARTRALIAQNWADLYLTDHLTAGEIRAVQGMRTPNDVLRFLGNKLSEPAYRGYMNLVNEEITCELNAGRYSWFAGANHGELAGCEEATKLVRTALMNDGVFKQGALDNVGDLISRVNKDVQALVDKKAEAAFEQAKKNAEPASRFDPDKRFGLYSVPYNGKRDLVAVRNTSVSSAIRAILDGGMAMPSIAVTKVSRGYSSFGEVSVIFRSDTIDPSKNEANNVYSTDAYTPMYPTVSETFVGDVDAAEEYFNDLVKKILPGRNPNNTAFEDMIRGYIDLSDRADPRIKAAIAAEAGYDANELLDIGKQEVKKTEEFTAKLNKALGFKDARRFAVIYHDNIGEFQVNDADTGELYLDGVTYFENTETLSSLVFDEDETDAYNEVLDKLSDAYGSASAAANALYNAAALGDVAETVADIERKIKAKAKFSQYSEVERIDQELGYDYFIGENTESYTIKLKDGEYAFIKWDFDSDAFRPQSNDNAEKSTRWINQVVEDISQTEQVSRGEAMRRLRQYLGNAAGDSFSRGDLSSLLDAAIPDAAVKPWADNFISKFGERKTVLMQGDDRLDPTLKNALELMRKQNRRGGDDGDTYNLTAEGLHSRLSHWFESFEELKSHENIISETRDHNNTAYNDADESLAYLKERLENGYENGNEDRWSETPNADLFLYDIANRLEARKGVRKDTDKNLIEYVADSLQQSGWKEHDADTANDMAEYILAVFEQIADLPTGYFEAKPDRIVSKDEYAMLLIPRDSDNSHYATADNSKIQELKRLCDENAIPYIEYSNDRTRTQIMQQDLGEYLFSKPYPGKQTQTNQQQTETPQIKHTPDRIKQSQDVNRSRTATKGETKAQFENNGETDYISRTNAQRSQTADLLTEDADPKVAQQKKDEQVRRLLTEDYAWTDDDVVVAQKLMFDMVKGIRDYQLHRSHKMSKEAFKRMTDQYNQLRDKHTRTLSESGQTLQANYMFSTGDKIVMKAAQTFLGFTKDGRFAGGSVNAKNATIYAGVEEAAKRIQSAVDAKDVQGLAKICKDISDIRNVKKMFGPLGKFASEMESRVLNRIAKGENAAENLENLAYGNLNAVCDDVQPYKAMNAAKTIRVMNMLSNTATIVNNLANNFAQGAVSKSMVNQALSNLASKPFEELTGQQVISKAQRGRGANKAVRNAQAEALETATLMQMYGITEENGRLELNDRGMFNPNINPFEQTMSLYKFLTGMGVEATDKMQAAGILKSMELGIDADIKAGKIEPHTKEQRMQEAKHEVNRLLYKDDNSTTALVQHIRDFLNKFHVGNDRVGTIGLGDITMAFAKIPANVVRARLAMTPEGALLQVAQYAKGVNKAKRMHAEVLAKGIVDSYREQIDAANTALQSAYEMEWGPAKDAAIRKAQSELSRLNSKMWAEAQDACRGSVYRNLRTISQNYNENMMFDEAVERAGYMNAKEMSQFEAAQLSRKIGRAATSAGMMALGSVLRALGALKDFDQEPDDELRKMNSDKGYRGLMMNLSAIGRKNHEWKDGDLIIDGEFLEVIAMPLTIGATAAEAAATAQDAKTWSWLKSMAGNGIAKTFEAVGDIPGMADAINMYESLTSAYTTDYDEKVSRLGAGLIQYAANTIPSFFMPNAVSQAAAGFDNKVRDVYAADTVWGQAKNIFMNKVPVLRNKVPVSVDVWGNERTYGEGPWGAINKMLLPGDVHVYRQNKYEAEIERLVREGYGNATPKTTVNSSFEVGDEKYTMTAQEKLDFKAARNSEQKELFEAFLDSKYYEQLNDAERMKVLQSLKTSAERDAKQDMLDSRQLNVQITRDKWETELLDVNDQIQFLTAKQLANNVLDRDAEDMDYAAVDQFLTGTYRGLSTTQRDLLNSSFSRLDDMYEAKFHYGISSETFNKGYDIYKDYMSQEGKDRVKGGYKDWEGSQMYTDIAKATGASEKQMDFFEDKFVLYNSNAVVPEKYNTLVDAGWGREAAQSLVKNVADLTPTNGRKNVSYKQRLTAIATTSGLTEAQRWEAFYEYCPSSYTSVLKKMGKYRSNGFSLAKALKAAGKWDP